MKHETEPRPWQPIESPMWTTLLLQEAFYHFHVYLEECSTAVAGSQAHFPLRRDVGVAPGESHLLLLSVCLPGLQHAPWMLQWLLLGILHCKYWLLQLKNCSAKCLRGPRQSKHRTSHSLFGCGRHKRPRTQLDVCWWAVSNTVLSLAKQQDEDVLVSVLRFLVALLVASVMPEAATPADFSTLQSRAIRAILYSHVLIRRLRSMLMYLALWCTVVLKIEDGR